MEDSSGRIAIFDFCETIVSFQSADAYINYILDMEKMLHPQISRIGSLFSKVCFRLFNISLRKIILLKKIKGLSREKLEKYAYQFYEKEIKPALIKESVEYLEKLKTQGYYIIIASAGFDIYIKYFAKEAGVDKIICSAIDFKKDKCTGKLVTYDLIGTKKVKKLKSILSKATLKDTDSIAISDSYSDLPLLKYCKKAVVVCKEKPCWLKHDMEVLLWT